MDIRKEAWETIDGCCKAGVSLFVGDLLKMAWAIQDGTIIFSGPKQDFNVYNWTKEEIENSPKELHNNGLMKDDVDDALELLCDYDKRLRLLG